MNTVLSQGSGLLLILGYFAVMKMGMNYQAFSAKIFKNIPVIVGLRTAESVQRKSCIATRRGSGDNRFVYPLYDWKDKDIWLYIRRFNLEMPVSYIYLYKVGVPVNRLRISQFFSIDTIKVLPKVLEFYPDLYERIVRREPNADLVMLYWDTDMFRSSQQDEKFDQEKDYRAMLAEAMKQAVAHPDMYAGFKIAKRLYVQCSEVTTQKTYKKIYQILVAGDPKGRTARVVSMDMKNGK